MIANHNRWRLLVALPTLGLVAASFLLKSWQDQEFLQSTFKTLYGSTSNDDALNSLNCEYMKHTPERYQQCITAMCDMYCHTVLPTTAKCLTDYLAASIASPVQWMCLAIYSLLTSLAIYSRFHGPLPEYGWEQEVNYWSRNYGIQFLLVLFAQTTLITYAVAIPGVLACPTPSPYADHKYESWSNAEDDLRTSAHLFKGISLFCNETESTCAGSDLINELHYTSNLLDLNTFKALTASLLELPIILMYVPTIVYAYVVANKQRTDEEKASIEEKEPLSLTT